MSAVQQEIHSPRMDPSVRSPQPLERSDRRTSKQAQSTAAKVFNRVSLAICCAASFAAVWLVAAQGASVYKTSYQNTKLQMQINQVKAKNVTLDAQVAQLKQPSRILNEAINQLHMKYKNPLVIPSKTTGK